MARKKFVYDYPRPAVAVDVVILTREEVDGLLADLLVTNSAPTGETKLSEWMLAHRESLGRRYQSELARHFRDSA